MQRRKIDPLNPDPVAIELAAQILRRGGLIIYPTDTCYGLGADARCQPAMERIIRLKGKRDAKKFSVIASDLDHIAELTIVDEEQQQILEQYLPGPYTFILMNADFTVAQTSTLGVRVPDFATTRALSQAFTDAYTTTSANLSGTGGLYTIADIDTQFLHAVDEEEWPDLILDAGDLPVRPSSTVVNLTTLEPTILREGAVPFVWPIED